MIYIWAIAIYLAFLIGISVLKSRRVKKTAPKGGFRTAWILPRPS